MVNHQVFLYCEYKLSGEIIKVQAFLQVFTSIVQDWRLIDPASAVRLTVVGIKLANGICTDKKVESVEWNILTVCGLWSIYQYTVSKLQSFLKLLCLNENLWKAHSTGQS